MLFSLKWRASDGSESYSTSDATADWVQKMVFGMFGITINDIGAFECIKDGKTFNIEVFVT